MPGVKKIPGLPAKNQTNGSSGVPNGLTSLAACYGDSDLSDDADDEAEAEVSVGHKEKDLIMDVEKENEATKIAPPASTESSESTEKVLAKESEVEFVAMVFNPQPESFKQVYIKEEPKSSDDSSTEDSESDSLTSAGSCEECDEEQDKTTGTKKRQAPKVKGEMTLYDLPPIEDLHISVPHEQCQPIGIIRSVVEPLVVVEAYPMTPALDIDSVLFLEEGDRALGRIFDVFGQVKQPHYCVRFNSLEHIDAQGIKPGMLVYCAPRTSHTTFVLVAQLKMMKGTDASWKDDIEPPADELEYSDDEMERNKKRGGRRGRVNLDRVQGTAETSSVGDAIPSGPPARGRKRMYGNQSTYVPAQVSGFGPPNRGGGFNYGFRGRGRGGYGHGGFEWNGAQAPRPYPFPNHEQQRAFQALQHQFGSQTPFFSQAPPLPPPSAVPYRYTPFNLHSNHIGSGAFVSQSQSMPPFNPATCHSLRPVLPPGTGCEWPGPQNN